MQAVGQTFFRGLLVFLPIFLTVYAVYLFGAWLNRMSTLLLARVWPEYAGVPGLGIAVGLVAIFALGLLVSSRMTRWIVHVVETPLRHLPIIRELYGALKQLTDFLSPDAKKRAGKVVSVRLAEHGGCLIGLLMREETDTIGLPHEDVDRVAVYLPMSYQIGGFTVFVPKDRVVVLDIPVETALRETLTGWISTADDDGTAPG